MSKKKRKLSKFDKMRIARDAYKGMMLYWKEQAEELRLELIAERIVSDLNMELADGAGAREARLGGALDLLLEALATESAEHIAQLMDDAEELMADTTPDDWLAQHDAEVRRGERERYREVLEDVKDRLHQLEIALDTDGSLAREVFLHLEGCVNAAIKEADDDNS